MSLFIVSHSESLYFSYFRYYEQNLYTPHSTTVIEIDCLGTENNVEECIFNVVDHYYYSGPILNNTAFVICQGMNIFE